MKHKHAEVIKAFVDGVECEYYGEGNLGLWYLITYLDQFDTWDIVRIKPKLDVVEYYYADSLNRLHLVREHEAELKVTFDGETNKLKDAEVIK